ncbi:N-acetylmuramoyl-L-alanine amidase [Paenibacillus sp. GCM10027626]|uniref:N-acetylmuramoyl-L-alanine amidase family protein n=1 Tax=Paenibacillus sp. GCM10027626 TaxID=3273411 RepID=UPI00363CEDC2
MKRLQQIIMLGLVSILSFMSCAPDAAAFEDDPRYERALPSADIIIDAGHGGIDGGSFEGNVLEKDINLAVAKKLYVLLNKSGFRAVLNRSGDYALSDDNRWLPTRSRHHRDLSQRSQLTKEIETALVISLHVNSGKNKATRGPLVLHQKNGQSALLANCIQDTLNKQQNANRRPKLGKPFYLLNVVKAPAVIVEMGFISNPEERRLLTDPDYQMQTADAIASGVRNYLLLQ